MRRLTGREVVGYESQVLFSPDYVIEISLLGSAVEGIHAASRGSE